MNKMQVYIIVGIFLAAAWLLPALLLTIKVVKSKKLNPEFRKQLIIKMWTIPLIGNLICYLFFSKVGILPRLKENEHKNMWR